MTAKLDEFCQLLDQRLAVMTGSARLYGAVGVGGTGNMCMVLWIAGVRGAARAIAKREEQNGTP